MEIRPSSFSTEPSRHVPSQVITTPVLAPGAYGSEAVLSVTNLEQISKLLVTRETEACSVSWFPGTVGPHSRLFHLAVKAAESRHTSYCASTIKHYTEGEALPKSKRVTGSWPSTSFFAHYSPGITMRLMVSKLPGYLNHEGRASWSSPNAQRMY